MLLLLLALAGCGAPSLSAEDCAALASLPTTAAAAQAEREAGKSYSDGEIRQMYVCRVQGIGADDARWQAQGLPAEERARRAYQARHDARMAARALMGDSEEVARLQARDREKYGSPDGPTFEWLLQRAEEKGLRGEAAYTYIIQSAQRTDDATNKRFGL